jgi:hypothetical protein
MASSETTKPATALHGEPVSEIVAFAGHNAISDTQIRKPAQLLSRLFILAKAGAAAIAALAFGVAR